VGNPIWSNINLNIFFLNKYINYNVQIMNCDSSVNKVFGPWMNSQEKGLYSSPLHPDSYAMDTGGVSPRVQRLEYEADRSRW
jgi:hypothetical protein